MSDFYQPSGTLIRPGPIGRVVRLGLGVGALLGVQGVVSGWSVLVAPSMPTSAGFGFILLLGLYLFPYVVNLGFGFRLSGWPRLAVLGVGLAWAAINWSTTGHAWSPGLGAAFGVWALYTFGHLGVAFLLAALIRTPGCEMRSIPEAWGRLTGRPAREHFCPGHLDRLDRWEFRVRR